MKSLPPLKIFWSKAGNTLIFSYLDVSCEYLAQIPRNKKKEYL